MPEGSYFVDHKRGEVNELKGLLRNAKIDKNPAQKREVIKKVIAYMTLGIDVSKLFSDMIMATNTSDLVQKKMVYLYLCTYAVQKPELALLAINTLQKDGRDDDPMVRGLALRSLCSLRVTNLVEYVMEPIKDGLNDASPYVRKTAVIGVSKLFHMSPENVRDTEFVDALYNMIKDRDTGVVTNAIHALNEIMAEEGGMAVNKQIVMHLLNRIKHFNEWGQCTVLELVNKYKPTEEETIFDIMNVLNDRLKHSNSAVVLGTVKVFLHLTQNMRQVQHQVYDRIRAPLLTLMNSQTFELSYPVLAHVSLLVTRAPSIFEDSYKQFFCRFNDPPSVKLVKLETLTELACENNVTEVLNELSEYVTDVDNDVARQSITCIGKLAVQIDSCVDKSLQHLLSFLDLNMEYVSAETCIVIKNILRKYPDRYDEVLPLLKKCLKSIDEPAGKTAVIWMIGEYGETIDDAPYTLEMFIDNFEDEQSAEVRMELLAATMKLFFKRPPEVQKMLGRLLAAAVSNTSQVDVRDRALMYYRLLHHDVHEAARIVNCPKVIVDVFVESEELAARDKIFQEFNTLAIVYGKPSEEFIVDKDFIAEESDESDDSSDEDDDEYEEKDSRKRRNSIPKLQQQKRTNITYGNGNLGSCMTCDCEEFEPDKWKSHICKLCRHSVKTHTGGEAGARPSADDGSSDLIGLGSTTKRGLTLKANAQCNSKEFQTKWTSLNNAQQISVTLSDPGSMSHVEELLHNKNFCTMASGTVGKQKKLYLYGSSERSMMFLEILIDLDTGQIEATLKCEHDTISTEAHDLFIDTIKSVLR